MKCIKTFTFDIPSALSGKRIKNIRKRRRTDQPASQEPCFLLQKTIMAHPWSGGNPVKAKRHVMEKKNQNRSAIDCALYFGGGPLSYWGCTPVTWLGVGAVCVCVYLPCVPSCRRRYPPPPPSGAMIVAYGTYYRLTSCGLTDPYMMETGVFTLHDPNYWAFSVCVGVHREIGEVWYTVRTGMFLRMELRDQVCASNGNVRIQPTWLVYTLMLLHTVGSIPYLFSFSLLSQSSIIQFNSIEG